MASAVHSLRVPVGREFVCGFLHSPTKAGEQTIAEAGAILVSGAGGGVYGPTGIWMSLATRLAQAGVPAIRLDYREPNQTPSCADDIQAAVGTLHSQFGVQRVGLVGWSFGSAPIFTFASKARRKSVVPVQVGACAIVAPQTADAFGIGQCPPMPVLLVHGTNDRCLSPECSKRLKSAYEEADASKEGKCQLLLLEGDDHCLSREYARAEQHILDFLLDALLGGEGHGHPLEHTLVPSAKTGRDWMRRGHDLARAPSTGECESTNEPTRHNAL